MKLSENLSELFLNIANELSHCVAEIQVALQTVNSQINENIPQQTKDDIQQVCKSVATLQKGIERFKTKELPLLLQDSTGITNKLSVIRHDLRTPINAIKGYGEIIIEDLAGSEQPQLIESFNKVIKLSNRILAKIIALNEAETVSKEPYDIFQTESQASSDYTMDNPIKDLSLDLPTEAKETQNIISSPTAQLSHNQQNKSFAVLIPAQKTGGNFYNFYHLVNGQLGCCIGNVSDKSIDETLLSSVPHIIVDTLTTAASSDELTMSVRAANDILNIKNDPLLLVTLIAVIVDPSSQTLHFVNAGHCAPLIVKQNGSIIELAGSYDHPLGVVPNIPYTELTYQIESGDTLFLYTKGLIKAVNQQGEIFGAERLKALLSSCMGMSTKNSVGKIIVEVIKFSDQSTLHEDLTCVAINL